MAGTTKTTHNRDPYSEKEKAAHQDAEDRKRAAERQKKTDAQAAKDRAQKKT